MKHHETAKVLSITKVAPEHFNISLAAPRISRDSEPGQFIMIKIGDTTDPLLRRPISLCGIDVFKGTVDIMFRVVGKGTRILSEVEPGEDLDIIGPLGTGFNVDIKKDLAIIVGGGIGIAPLLGLAKEIKPRFKAVYALIGAKNINQVLCEEDLRQLGCEVEVTTDDGTYGKKGKVTDALMELVTSKISDMHSCIYACGPRPMLKEIQSISGEYSVPAQASLEEWMACGTGACFGCTINTKQGYKKVCSDGPVFDIKDILWQK